MDYAVNLFDLLQSKIYDHVLYYYIIAFGIQTATFLIATNDNISRYFRARSSPHVLPSASNEGGRAAN